MKAAQFQLWPCALLLAMAMVLPVQAAGTFSSLYISEIMADNQHGLKDEDGDYSGWIEIYNASSSTIYLANWCLTDNTNNLFKWRFPRVSLLPEKYIYVFASGKDRTNSPVYLHTNFRLNKKGGYLALVGRSTNVVSELAPYPPQRMDVSYGSVRGEPSLRGFFQQPTPGKANSASGPGFAAGVGFSERTRNFVTPLRLQLTNPSRKAVIRYSLDGSMPNRNSFEYKAPLEITNTVQVRARAYTEGLLPGPPQSEFFVLLHSNVLNFTSTLPVLVMETFGKDPQVGSSRYSGLELSFFEPSHGVTSLTNAPTLVTRGGYHTRGSSSSGMPQASFAMEFVDEFNDGEGHSPLGLPADSDWVLYAPNNYDPIMIHNPFVHQLSRDIGQYSPRTKFLEVFLVQNSGPLNRAPYYGIYVLEEKIKVGKNRVNIDKLGPADLKAPEVTGGYLLKLDRPGPGESGFGAAGVNMFYVEPKEWVIALPQRNAQQKYLYKFFNDFEAALNSPDWRDPSKGYPAFVDVDQLIDYHLVEVLSGNVDSLNLSAYLYKPRNGKLCFGPHWDFDRALGSTDHRDTYPRVWNTGNFFGAPWWHRMFNDPDFWQQWVDRWQELRQREFSLEHLFGLIDRLTGELREAQPREVKRWGLQPRGGTYQAEIDHMKDWLSNRIDFIDRELVSPPKLSHKGGAVPPNFTVTLTAATNTSIYYTLNGTDPRLPHGAISSNALLYTAPIQLTNKAELFARARNPNKRQRGGPPISTPWSGPVEASLVIKR